MFVGREKELRDLQRLYEEDSFQMFVLYGRRRVGKTTLLNEFCKGKGTIFYSAEQSSRKSNLDKFSQQIFSYYGETNLQPFLDWEKAFSYIEEKQEGERLIVVLDEFPYLAQQDPSMISVLQHLIDHKLCFGRLFLILCGSYMGFMEKEVLGAESPLFGRRTAQLKLKTFVFFTAKEMMKGFSLEDQMLLYGILGGTPMYLARLNPKRSLQENITDLFLMPTGYLYEEPMLLLRQEVQEPSVYYSIMEAIASGAVRANEIAQKTGEEAAKCLKYIRVLAELGMLWKEVPFGEKYTSRKTMYGIADFMFRFWFRYVSENRTLLETGAQKAVWEKRILPDLNHYMGLVFEEICKEYLMRENSEGRLPILFTKLGRWWGSNPVTRQQEEIDLIAQDGTRYIFAECKWRREKADYGILIDLQRKADVFCGKREETFYFLFSKGGFTETLKEMAVKDKHLLLISMEELL